jgi:hypothetical protein
MTRIDLVIPSVLRSFGLATAMTLAFPTLAAHAQPPATAEPSLTPTDAAAASPPAPVAPAHPAEPAATVTARLGRGFEVRSADGRFSMNIRGRAQLRYELVTDSFRPGEANGSSTFMARRVRLLVQGQLFNEDWNYYVQFGFSNRDTESDLRLPLRDAYMTWSGVRDMNVRFGQGKVPTGRQRVVSSSALQMPDRSIITNEFNLDRDVGIQIFSNDLFGLDGRLGYNLGVYGGDGRNRTGGDFGMLYVARVSFLPMGRFDDFIEADVTRSAEPHLAISASGVINMNSVRYRSTFDRTYTLGSFDFAHGGFDAQFKWRGLSVQAEAFVRTVIGSRRSYVDSTDPLNVVTETARTGAGYYVQAGYMLNDHAEVVARWGEMRPFTSVTNALPQEGELGAGFNWYFQRHDFKIQADYFYYYDGDFSDRAGEHGLRIQSQFFL